MEMEDEEGNGCSDMEGMMEMEDGDNVEGAAVRKDEWENRWEERGRETQDGGEKRSIMKMADELVTFYERHKSAVPWMPGTLEAFLKWTGLDLFRGASAVAVDQKRILSAAQYTVYCSRSTKPGARLIPIDICVIMEHFLVWEEMQEYLPARRDGLVFELGRKRGGSSAVHLIPYTAREMSAILDIPDGKEKRRLNLSGLTLLLRDKQQSIDDRVSGVRIFLAALWYALKIWETDVKMCPLQRISELHWLLVIYSAPALEEEVRSRVRSRVGSRAVLHQLELKNVLKHAETCIRKDTPFERSDTHAISPLKENERQKCADYLKWLQREDVLHVLLEWLLRKARAPEGSAKSTDERRVDVEVARTTEYSSGNNAEPKRTIYTETLNTGSYDEVAECPTCVKASSFEVTMLQDVQVERGMLGRGAFGDVIPGLSEGKAVAIKFIAIEKSKQRQESERENRQRRETERETKQQQETTEREWKMMKRLAEGEGMDQHVVTSLGICRHLQLGDGIVMEWHGVSLHFLLEKAEEYAADDVVLEVALKLAKSIQMIHDKGIVHGDIHPRNVLVSVSADGELVVKLCDFGHAVCLHWGGDGAKRTLQAARYYPSGWGLLQRS